MATEYRNAFHTPNGNYGPETYRTDSKPVQIGKYMRVKRAGGYDFVMDGVCFAMRAGPATEASIDTDYYAQENIARFFPARAHEFAELRAACHREMSAA